MLQRHPAKLFLEATPARVLWSRWIAGKIAAREEARRRKDYAAADRIRQELLELGIVLEDKGGKTTWRRA